ncbi:MAG: diacylglycerol/lipid kinase family protein [Christensenellales bacterium]|jgi:diacylglycerol kinase (ATP)
MYSFIVNPKAGRGRALKYIARVETRLKELGEPYEVLYSQHSGHSITLAQSLKTQKRAAVVAVGGDGTLVEVATGLAGSDCIMGVIPAGTGNDFSRTLGIPRDPELALDTVLNGKIIQSDMGLINGKDYFLNVAGLGFDVSVLKHSYKTNRIFKGMAAYFLAVLLALVNLKFPRVKITTPDGVIEQEALMLAVANGRCFGGGMMVAPDARLDDGLFNVCLIRKLGRLSVLKLLPSFIKGSHLKNKYVTYFKCSRITAECTPVNQLNMDGELGGFTPVTFEVLPGHISILTPRQPS